MQHWRRSTGLSLLFSSSWVAKKLEKGQLTWLKLRGWGKVLWRLDDRTPPAHAKKQGKKATCQIFTTRLTTIMSPIYSYLWSIHVDTAGHPSTFFFWIICMGRQPAISIVSSKSSLIQIHYHLFFALVLVNCLLLYYFIMSYIYLAPRFWYWTLFLTPFLTSPFWKKQCCKE